MRNSHQTYLEYDFGRSRLPADERLADAENRSLRSEIEWACDRLEVDDGMTAKEQATTARRLRTALAESERHPPGPRCTCKFHPDRDEIIEPDPQCAVHRSVCEAETDG